MQTTWSSSRKNFPTTNTRSSSVLSAGRAHLRHEKNPGTKAEMATAMQAAIDYCTPIYDALTDANAMEMVTPPTAPGHAPGSPQPRAAILIRNLAHNNEEYAVACLASNNRSKSRFAV